MPKVRGFKPQGIDNPLLNTGAKPHREIDGELSLAIAKLASKPRLTVEEYQARLRKKEEEENKRIDEWDAKYGDAYRRKLAEEREKVLNPSKEKKHRHHHHHHHHHRHKKHKKHGSSSPSSSSSGSSSSKSSDDEKGKGPWKLSAFFQATENEESDKKSKKRKKKHHHHHHHRKHKSRSHSKRGSSSESGSGSSIYNGSDSIPQKKIKTTEDSQT